MQASSTSWRAPLFQVRPPRMRRPRAHPGARQPAGRIKSERRLVSTRSCLPLGSPVSSESPGPNPCTPLTPRGRCFDKIARLTCCEAPLRGFPTPHLRRATPIAHGVAWTQGDDGGAPPAHAHQAAEPVALVEQDVQVRRGACGPAGVAALHRLQLVRRVEEPEQVLAASPPLSASRSQCLFQSRRWSKGADVYVNSHGGEAATKIGKDAHASEIFGRPMPDPA